MPRVAASLVSVLATCAAVELGVASDVKYIRCAICEQLVGALHDHVTAGKQSKALSSEEDVQSAVEVSCKPDTDAGAWLRFLDLVEDLETQRLHVVRQEEDGPCGKECQTAARACSAILEEGWENELGEALYAGVGSGGVGGLQTKACRQWSSACRKPPPLDPARPLGPAFRVYTDEERAARDARSGKGPPPGLLSEESLRWRMGVDGAGKPS
jgi:hypothetical protein